MKRIIVALAALVLLLTGCGSQEPSQAESAPAETSATETPVFADSNKKLLTVQPINQNPELPTGCEVTSLTVVLQYNGIKIDKCAIADRYIEKGEVGYVDFREAFVGNPRDELSYGCYAPVIVKAADKILTERRSKLRAKEVSGKELEALFDYIDKGVPVIIWGTLDCKPSSFTEVWTLDTKTIQWVAPEHCMVLTGYDDTSVWVADPMKGAIVCFEKEQFRSGYNALYKQAVVIQ